MESNEQIKEQINKLEKQLRGDMFHDMDLRQQIHELKMKLNNVRPELKEANTLYCNC